MTLNMDVRVWSVLQAPLYWYCVTPGGLVSDVMSYPYLCVTDVDQACKHVVLVVDGHNFRFRFTFTETKMGIIFHNVAKSGKVELAKDVLVQCACKSTFAGKKRKEK